MNPLDGLVLALIAVGVLLGWRSGAFPQIGGLVGAAVGVAIGLAAIPVAVGLLDPAPIPVRAVVLVGLLVGAVGVGELLGARVGRRVSRALGTGLLSALDRVAGAIVGLGQAVLVVWLVGGILATGAVPQLGAYAQSARSIRALAVLLPPPSTLVVELEQAFSASGLPDVFLGLERPPAGPVDLPNSSLARSLAQHADGSVFRVVADACAYRSTGTGFVVAREYLVTNAHVVAGSSSISIDLPGPRLAATPVLYDPELDIAVLHVDGLSAAPLFFAGGLPARGDVGATYGYPNGGPADVEPAAVTATYAAEGLDVTGSQRVTREIVELLATIQPGDSGGPLLLANGTVGGVVFAESRTNATVGYALSPTAVSVAMAPALSRTRAVSTGACLH